MALLEAPVATGRAHPRPAHLAGASVSLVDVAIGWAPFLAIGEVAVLMYRSGDIAACVAWLLFAWWQLGGWLPVVWFIRPRLERDPGSAGSATVVLALRRAAAGDTIEQLYGRVALCSVSGLLYPPLAVAAWRPFLGAKRAFGLQTLSVRGARYPFPDRELACALHLEFRRDQAELSGLRAGPAHHSGDARTLVEAAMRLALTRGASSIHCHSSAPVLRRLASRHQWFDRAMAFHGLSMAGLTGLSLAVSLSGAPLGWAGWLVRVPMLVPGALVCWGIARRDIARWTLNWHGFGKLTLDVTGCQSRSELVEARAPQEAFAR